MKTCPTCGHDADDRFLYCPDDGSALGDLQKGGEALTPDKTTSNASSKVSVLFCPACEGEYPLTFSACPIDGLRLTRERGRFRRSTTAQVEVAHPLAAPPQSLPSTPAPDRSSAYEEEDATAHYYSDDEGLSDEETDYDDGRAALATDTGLIEKIRTDRPSFRIAAIATLVGLALFGLSAVYRLYTYGMKKPSSPVPVATTADQKESRPSFFIETPKEAREYVEEDAAPAEAKMQPHQEKTEIARPAQQQEPVKKQPVRPEPDAAGRLKEVSAPVAPHSTGGRVKSRLVHIRANRTQSGYRYDLTFTLHDLSGRPARWNSLTVSARSESGVNHLQTLPFHHRSGASGTLTFTVSVDMTGRSKADWRGRIVCTTVGSDHSGRPLKATFGANVSP